MLIFIAIFVYLAASSEAHFVAMRSMSSGVPVSAAMMTQYATLTPDRRRRGRRADAAAHQPERIPGGRRRRQAGGPAGARRHHPRAQGARPRRPRRRRDDDRDRRRSAIASVWTTRSSSCRRSRRRRWPWSMPSGRLVGLVTSETIGEMMMVREALPKGATFGPWGRSRGREPGQSGPFKTLIVNAHCPAMVSQTRRCFFVRDDYVARKTRAHWLRSLARFQQKWPRFC